MLGALASRKLGIAVDPARMLAHGAAGRRPWTVTDIRWLPLRLLRQRGGRFCAATAAGSRRAPAPARARERAPADCCRECSWGRPLHRRPADHECDDRADQEHDEKDLGDAGRSGNDATKAEHRGDDRDDEEDDGVCSMVPSACAGSFRCKMSRTLGARAGVGTGSGTEARVGCGLRRACLRHT